jgi:hypothetical protein
MRRESVKYQVAWVWRHEGADATVKHDDVEASTARGAITKLRKLLRESDYDANEAVVLEVYRI